MSYYQDRYCELEEIRDRLKSLINNIYDKEYISTFEDILKEVEDEFEEVSEEVSRMERAEAEELQREYDSMRL